MFSYNSIHPLRIGCPPRVVKRLRWQVSYHVILVLPYDMQIVNVEHLVRIDGDEYRARVRVDLALLIPDLQVPEEGALCQVRQAVHVIGALHCHHLLRLFHFDNSMTQRTP